MEAQAQLVGLKRYAELRKEESNRKHMPWFCGISCAGGWRVGELVEFMYSYTKLKDEVGEFTIPASHLCYFTKE